MSEAALLIRGVRWVDGYRDEPLDLLVTPEIVRPAGPKDVAREEIAGRGLVAMPGLADYHVHLRQPGQEHKETIRTGTMAAAAGGIATVVCEPNTEPPIDNPDTVGKLLELSRDSVVTFRTKACLSLGQAGERLTDFAGLLEAGAVAVSDDGEPVPSASLLDRAIREAKECSDGDHRPLIALHCEETPRSAARIADWLGPGEPYQREPELIRRAIEKAEEVGEPVHFSHVSMAESVRLIRLARQRGLAVTAEATPHHLCLSAEDVPAGDPSFKMNPPLRRPEDMAALRGALAAGMIGMVASDHAPHAPEEKAQPYPGAPFGVVGLETSLGVILTNLVGQGLLDLKAVAMRMAVVPAGRIYGRRSLKRVRGDFPYGGWTWTGPANLTLIDPDHYWTVEPERFYSKGRNTPFAGWKLRGRAVLTIVEGRVVMRDGEVLVQ